MNNLNYSFPCYNIQDKSDSPMDVDLEERGNLSTFNLNFIKIFENLESVENNSNNFNNNFTNNNNNNYNQYNNFNFSPPKKKNSLDISYSIEQTFCENSNININIEEEEPCKNMS
jgi:hypothetical protein